MIIHEFDLDMIPGGNVPSIRVNQYDEDFNLKINLFSRNGNFSVLSGTTALVRGTKPDGNAYSAEVSVSGTVVTVPGNQQITAAAGKAIFEISLRRNGKELNTANFVIDIEQAAMDKDTVASTSVVRELVDIMDNSEEIINAGQQYENSQRAMEELTERSEAAAETATTMKTQTEEIATQTAEKWTEVSEQMDRKSAAIATLVTNADEVAAEASEKAGNALNEAAEVSNSLEDLQQKITELQLNQTRFVADGYVEDEEGVFVDKDGNELFRMSGIGGSGGGGGSSDQTVKSTVTMDNMTGWLSKTIAADAGCPISFVWSSTMEGIPTGNGVVSVTVNNVVKATMDVAQGAVEIDLAPYMTASVNRVEVRVTDIEGQYKRINYSITIMQLSLSSTFDVATPYTGAIPFPYTPIGAVQKTVHFILDGTEIGTQQTSVTGRQMTYTIPAQAHGGHSIRVYFEAEINGETVRSNELYYEFTCLEAMSDEVIITSPYNQATQPQYASIAIPFTVYDPVSPTAEVKIYANDELLSTQTVDRSEQSYTYRATEAGPLKIDIKCHGTTKTFNITVTESEVQIEAETENLMLFLSSQGRSNNEENPWTWVSNVGENEVNAVLTGFNGASDGWQSDENGITCLRVTGGARVQIPYQVFGSDIRRGGFTFEIEYATRNVSDYSSTIVSCMNGGRGLEITPQKATLKSEQTELYMQYKEGEHIRVAYTVGKRSENRLVKSYIEGKIARVTQYPDDDDFAQVAPVGISIGSDDCTIDIYCIRVYANDLTANQVMDNWIADTQDGSLMLERYARNQIFDAYGQVVPGQLPSNLPYMIIECEELPQYKGDKKTVNVSYTDPLYPSHSFTAEKVQANVQGTSSAPYAVKNLDLQFKGGFEMTTTGHSKLYRLRDDSMPTARFVLKADVASSESANNTQLVRLYNDLCPYKTPEMEEDERVRWGIDGIQIVMFWRDTVTGDLHFKGKYNFNFPKRFPEGYGYTEDQESWEWQNNTSDRMLFKSDDFDSIYTDPETLEQFPAWKNDFEARFPEDTWEDIDKLKEWISWVVSTDRDQATGDALEAPVTYDGTEYTADTAEYRLAKFKAELADYAEVDTLIFYYVWTEFFLMVDSRAKNLFMGFHGSPCEIEGSAIDRKIVAEPYDMDTGLGTNNEGTLTYTYSLEDLDTIAGADVFNGQHSVLWCNLRDTHRAAIVNMYQTLRSSGGLNYKAVEKRYEDAQNIWPEAVWNEDGRIKYTDPLTNPETGKEPTAFYLPMAQGSKEQQRKWWLGNRFAYMDSKWNAGDALAQVIQLRGYAKADITVTPYIDLYPTVKYGSYLVQQRGTAGTPATLACPMDSVNDTEIYIYSAPQIASVGDLSGLKVGVADFSQATNIQEVKLGDADPSYENNNMKRLSFGSNVLLKKIDVRNCAMLGTDEQKSVDVSNCAILEEAYFDGTAIQGLSIPNGGVLRVLHVPATMSNLTIRNQKNLAEFVIPSYSNISTLWLENNSAVIDTLDIVKKVPANARIHLVGVAWEAADAAEIRTVLDILDTMRGLDDYGNNQDQAYVSGSIHTSSLTGAEVAEFEGRYPYLKILADHTTSYRTYADYDGTELKKVACIDGVPQESAPANPSRAQTAQYSYSFVGWSKSMNAETADSDALDNVIADRTIYAAYSKTVREYTVTWKNADGTTLRTDTLKYGATPSWGQAMPTNSSGQTAQGWTPTISTVTGNAAYTASYIPVYNVYFYNGTTLLKEQQVQQGGNATPPSETPVSADGPDYEFTGWLPGYTNIQGNTSCYAQFKAPSAVKEITDDWATIISKIANGTANYQVGNYKPLDLGTEGVVNMQIVGKNTSPLASGSGTATYDWLSMETLKTKHRMNPFYSAGTEGTGTLGGWEKCEMRTYLKETIKPLIPETVRNAIKEVTKYTRIYTASPEAAVNDVASTEDVWIPSRHEMFDGTTEYYETKGPRYSEIFPDNASRKKMQVGASSASEWWLRSAYGNSTFNGVYSSGTFSNNGASSSCALALGFSI